MLNIRIEAVEDFYRTMSEWLSKHDWDILDINALPDKVFVANDGENDVYCCSLYETNSCFGVVAFPISNRDVKKNREHLVELFKFVENHAREIGIKLLFTTSGTPVVEKALKKAGYEFGDKNVNQYLRWVKQ